jgi:hypothetical protein
MRLTGLPRLRESISSSESSNSRQRRSDYWPNYLHMIGEDTHEIPVTMGIVLSTMGSYSYRGVAIFFTLMGFGLAFTDVLTDALTVENGKRLGLTGPFQAIQWALISPSILTGVGGGWLAQHKFLWLTFVIASVFPAITLAMVSS